MLPGSVSLENHRMHAGRRCSQASRMEAAGAPEAPSDIGGVWDALCSGQPPPGASHRPDGIAHGCTGGSNGQQLLNTPQYICNFDINYSFSSHLGHSDV